MGTEGRSPDKLCSQLATMFFNDSRQGRQWCTMLREADADSKLEGERLSRARTVQAEEIKREGAEEILRKEKDG